MGVLVEDLGVWGRQPVARQIDRQTDTTWVGRKGWALADGNGAVELAVY